MSEITLVARKREEFTDVTLNQMRRNGYVPGIYYGHGVEGINIAAAENDLRPVIFTTESNIVNLKVQDASYPCILKDVQFHPLTDKPVHFDLLALKEGEEITLEINVHLTGNAAGVKEGGVLQHTLHKLEVECLPKFIPSHIDVEISALGIGDSIKVSDVKIDNVKIKNDEGAVIVAVVPPTVVKEAAETAEETPSEPEVLSKGKKEDEE